MPQNVMDGQQPPLYGEPPAVGEDGEEKEGGEGEGGDYNYEDDDRLIDTFSVKDGGPIPLLQVPESRLTLVSDLNLLEMPLNVFMKVSSE